MIDGIIACALSVAGVLGVLTGGLGLPRSAADGLAVGVKQAERNRTGEQTDTRVAVDV